MSQILAIAELRFKTAARRVRGTTRAINTLAAALLFLVLTAFALFMAITFGVLIRGASGDPKLVRAYQLAAFYVFFALAVVLPLIQGALEQGIDLRRFRVFPIGRIRLYLITLLGAVLGAEHALYYPALLTVAGATVLWASPGVVLVLLVIGLLFVSYVSWSHVVHLALAEITRARRVREILTITALLLLVVVSFGTNFLLEVRDRSGSEAATYARSLGSAAVIAARALPPNLAADAIATTPLGGFPSVAGRMVALVLWDALGIALGFWILNRHHRAERAGAPQRKQTLAAPRPRVAALTFDSPWLAAIPIESRALAAKDLRYLLRSVSGRFALFVVPVIVVVVGGVLADSLDQPVLGIAPENVLLYGVVLYSIALSSNSLNNAFAWERAGIQAYFMSPAPLERVIFGKNLGTWLFNGIVLGVALICWTALMGFPGVATALSALLVFAIALVVVTTAGNVLSVLFPVGRDISSMRTSPSQASILLGLVAMIVGTAFGGAAFAAAWFLAAEALLPLFLAAVFAGSLGIYALGLKLAARLLAERKEQMIRALRTEA